MINCALIGLGRWGRVLMNYIDLHPEFNLLYIYTTSKKQQVPRATDDLEVLLSSDVLEVVFIASPLSYHHFYASLFISKGLHVLVEKPLTVKSGEAKMLQELAQKNGVILQTNYNWLFSPGIQILKHLSQDKKIQSIHIEITQMGICYADEDVYQTLGSHALSICLFLIGGLSGSNIQYTDEVYDQQGVVRSGHMAFIKDGTRVDIYLDLLNASKKRKITINLLTETVEYDMIGEDTILHYSTERQLINKYIFDEKNTVAISLQHFFETIQDKNGGNIIHSIEIVNLLERTEADEKV